MNMGLPESPPIRPIMIPETAGVLLHLNYLRSAFVVGMSLAAKYPTEEEWEEHTQDPEFLKQIDQFVLFLDKLRIEQDGQLTLEKAQTLGEQSSGDAQTLLVDIAESWDIPVEDLLTVFVNS